MYKLYDNIICEDRISRMQCEHRHLFMFYLALKRVLPFNYKMAIIFIFMLINYIYLVSAIVIAA